jgi:hypothetical protein
MAQLVPIASHSHRGLSPVLAGQVQTGNRLNGFLSVTLKMHRAKAAV